LVFTFMVAVVDEAAAQRRGTKKRRTREDTSEQTSRSRSSRSDEYQTPSFTDKLNYEIKPGNLFIGNITFLSLKANAGYNINKTFSTGLGGKYYYEWQSGFGGVSDYGGFLYARGKITREIYLLAEYNLLSLGPLAGFPNSRRTSITYPAAGFGYTRPGIDWSSGLEFLIIFSEEGRNALQLPFEYWITFSYNF